MFIPAALVLPDMNTKGEYEVEAEEEAEEAEEAEAGEADVTPALKRLNIYNA